MIFGPLTYAYSLDEKILALVAPITFSTILLFWAARKAKAKIKHVHKTKKIKGIFRWVSKTILSLLFISFPYLSYFLQCNTASGM